MKEYKKLICIYGLRHNKIKNKTYNAEVKSVAHPLILSKITIKKFVRLRLYNNFF